MTSLEVDARADMKEGILGGTNLLQKAMADIPFLSGIWDAVVAELPQDTRTDLKNGVTLIERAGTKIRLKGNDLFVDPLDIVSRDAAFLASGTARLGGAVEMKGDVAVSAAISDVLLRKVPDLSALRGEDGRIRVPVLIDGPLAGPRVRADEKYLTSTILLERGKKELEKLADKNPAVMQALQSFLGGKNTEGEANTQEPVAPGDNKAEAAGSEASGSGAVKALFNMILDKK